jgi:hypothetical protein
MTWRIIDGRIGLPAITDTSTTKKAPLGTIVQAEDPTYGVGEFIYLTGVASTVVGSWVGYFPATGATILATANGTYPLAVAMSANVASQYGWYQISGVATALGLTSITHTSGFLALTGTAGSVDDASVIGDHIFNARKTTTVHVVGTFLDTYSINRPFSTNIVTVRN